MMRFLERTTHEERAAARIDYTSIIAKRDIFDEKRLMSKPLSLRSPDLAPLLAKFRELCTDTNFQVVKVAYLKSLPGGERQVLHTDTKEGCISALIPLNCQLNVRLYFLSIFETKRNWENLVFCYPMHVVLVAKKTLNPMVVDYGAKRGTLLGDTLCLCKNTIGKASLYFPTSENRSKRFCEWISKTCTKTLCHEMLPMTTLKESVSSKRKINGYSKLLKDIEVAINDRPARKNVARIVFR